MRLLELVNILKNTELKQIVVGKDTEQVIAYLNLAMIEVYGKFNILQEEQNIEIIPGVTRYRLQENSQRVLQVYYRNIKENPLNGNDAYKEVPINDINDDESVFVPEPYILHVPNPEDGRVYSIIHTVTPPFITSENIEILDITIPPQFLEPIMYYAAYRAYKSMNGDMQSEIGSHYQTYMTACDEVYRKGMVNYSILTNTKLTERGFA